MVVIAALRENVGQRRSPTGRDGCSGPKMRDRRPGRLLRKRRGPEARRWHGLSQAHEDGDADDFVSRQYPPTDPGHTPHGAPTGRHHRPWCTTMDQTGYAFPRGAAARTMTGPGSARSSAQAVPALGPAGLQDGAPCPGAHTCAKTVLSRLSAVIRLKCALHLRLLTCGPRRGLLANMGVPAPAARDELSTG